MINLLLLERLARSGLGKTAGRELHPPRTISVGGNPPLP